MAFFQFRKGRDEPPAKLSAPQTAEVVRRRAMHRLIGAAVLVLAGVIGFPLIFDNQPRPIPVDLPIEIADKNKVKPLVAPAPVAPAAVTAPAVPAAPSAAVVVAPAPVPVPAAAVKPAVPVPAAPAKATEAPVAKASDAGKAQALLDGKQVVSDGRFVVQVGAYTDLDKVQEVRRKVEGAGLRTYTQVVETKDGSRTRVRVGPFPDKVEAQTVAEKIRKLDLPAAVLGL